MNEKKKKKKKKKEKTWVKAFAREANAGLSKQTTRVEQVALRYAGQLSCPVLGELGAVLDSLRGWLVHQLHEVNSDHLEWRISISGDRGFPLAQYNVPNSGFVRVVWLPVFITELQW